MSNIVKRNGSALSSFTSEPASPVGKAMVMGGGGALSVAALAALLPGGFLVWAFILIALGLFVV